MRHILFRTKNYLKYVLDLSPSEIRGIFGLIFILILVDLYHLIDIRLPLPEDEAARLTHYIVEMNKEQPIVPMVPFMPDTVSKSTLQQWGWPERLATNLISYRSKAGKFRSANQIERLYGMTDSLFTVISPYLILETPEKKPMKTDTVRQPVRRNHCPDPMDINMADSTMLTYLHGIGPVLSARIVGYRELLGGFVSVGQLEEVYGLKKETFEHISDRLYVDPAYTPRQIPYRDGTYQELYDHPYLDSKQAVFLIRYRQQHGAGELLKGLQSNPRFKKRDIERLKHYLPLSDSTGLAR